MLFYGIFFLLSLFKKKKCSRDIEDTQVIDSADNIVKEKSVSTNKTKWKKRIVKTIGWLILIAACIVAAAIAITEYNRHQEYVEFVLKIILFLLDPTMDVAVDGNFNMERAPI